MAQTSPVSIAIASQSCTASAMPSKPSQSPRNFRLTIWSRPSAERLTIFTNPEFITYRCVNARPAW